MHSKIVSQRYVLVLMTFLTKSIYEFKVISNLQRDNNGPLSRHLYQTMCKQCFKDGLQIIFRYILYFIV